LVGSAALAPNASANERQSLALIYGLAGDRAAAKKVARLDLDAASVQSNLTYYDMLRRLSPEARLRALQSVGSPTKTAAGS
jgi:Flp pilus assembly protein TadD